MDTPAKTLLPPAARGDRRLILWLPLAYVLLSGAILFTLLLQLRQQAFDSGEQLIASFARLAQEQTSRTIHSTAATVAIVESWLNGGAAVPEPAFIDRLRRSLDGRPFMRSIWVLDAAGRVVHGTDGGGMPDHADQPYFRRFSADAAAGLEVFAPIRGGADNAWLIPLARAWLRPDGSFAGVIVVALDPRYFVRTWNLDLLDRDLAIALFRRDGVLLARSPHEERIMGRSFAAGPLFTAHLPAAPVGTYRHVSPIDDRDRLIGFHALNEYPGLLIAVGHTVDHVLAGWRRTALIVLLGWLAASAALGGMAWWLWREWVQRHRSEDRYRLLFDANPHPMAVYDPRSLRFLAVNDAAVRRYGWSREEFLGGMTLADIQPSEDLPRLREAVASGGDFHRMRHWSRDRTTFEVEATVQPIDLAGSRAVLAMALDVTERNLNRRRLADAIQAFPGSFRLFDRDERLVLSNEVNWGSGQIELPAPQPGTTFEAMARYAADNELDAAAVGRGQEWLRERIEQFRRADTDTEIQWRDGRWFQLLERRTSDGGTISIRLDITARKAIEEQLRQSQKMEAVGQLTGGVAHDLNNMLTVIMGNTETLLENRTLDADAREMLEMMLSAAEGSAGLTNRLLAFARKRPLQPKRVDVNAFVERMQDLLKRSLGEQIEISLIRAASPWPVSVDPAQLEAAILNLAINARDAMPAGGRLTVGTANVSVGSPYAAMHGEVAAGDYVVVSISDTGVGMPPPVIARAFEPFYTTKEIGKGTGLGLSMVYGFVQQSGGHVAIHSEVGRGTTVRMYLPRAVEASHDAHAERAPAVNQRPETRPSHQSPERVRESVDGR